MTTHQLTKKRVQRDLFAASFFSLVVLLTAIALISTGGCSRKTVKNSTPDKPKFSEPELKDGEKVAGPDASAPATADNAAVEPSKACDTVTAENPEIIIGGEDNPNAFKTTFCRVKIAKTLLLSLKGQWTERDATATEQNVSARANSCFSSAKWTNLYEASDSREFLVSPFTYGMKVCSVPVDPKSTEDCIMPEDDIRSQKAYFEFNSPKLVHDAGNVDDMIGTPSKPGILTVLDAKIGLNQPTQVNDFFSEGLRLFNNDNCTVTANGGNGTLLPRTSMGSDKPEDITPPQMILGLRMLQVLESTDSDSLIIRAAFHVINEVETQTGSVKKLQVRRFIVDLDTGIEDYETLVFGEGLPKSSKLKLSLEHSYLASSLEEYESDESPMTFEGIIPTDSRVGFVRYFEKTNEKRRF